MRNFLYVVPMLAVAGVAHAGAPKPQSYLFTGTATVLSGGAGCLGASPLSITGDAVVTKNALALHIKSSNDVSAVAINVKNYNPKYGFPNSGSLDYLLLPQQAPYTGTYSGVDTALPKPNTFTLSMTINSGPFLIGKSGSCQIGLDLTVIPGVNKALLKLLQGVL